MHSTTRRLIGVSIAAAVASTLLIGAPSATAAGSARLAATSTDKATIGLFGEQDATYDGVYRQSLALIALDTADARVPAASVRWLKRQQCPNGRFPSFRADLDAPCGVGDSNATALATIAFKRLGEGSAARDSVNWLLDQQTRSGGWEYSTGWGPDSNSTGLVLQALIAMNIDPATVAKRRTGPEFLRTLQLDCSSEAIDDRGALDYQSQTSLVANNYATSQATQALAGSTLPVEPASADGALPAFTCPPEGTRPAAAATAAGYLGRTISANEGGIPGDFGPGTDLNSTANAVLSLVAAGYGAEQITSAMGTLETNATVFTRDAGDAVRPAAAAALVLTAYATSGDPRSVGGLNPVRDILQSRTLAG